MASSRYSSPQRLIDTQALLGTNPALGIDAWVKHYETVQAKLRSQGYETRWIVLATSVKDNRTLADRVNERPDLFLGGLLVVNPNKDLGEKWGYMEPGELEELARQEGIAGFKFNGYLTQTCLDDHRLTPYFQVAQRLGLPVTVHCGKEGYRYDSPAMARTVLEHTPNLTLICAHCGGWEEKKATSYLGLAHSHPNVWLNLAGVMGEDAQIQSLDPLRIHRTGADSKKWEAFVIRNGVILRDKALWGSDYGYLTTYTLEPVTLLPLGHKDSIFYYNAVRCFAPDPLRKAGLTPEKIERSFSATRPGPVIPASG